MIVRGIIAGAAACAALACVVTPSTAWAGKYVFSGTIDSLSGSSFVPLGTTFTGAVEWEAEPYEGYSFPAQGFAFHYNVQAFRINLGEYVQYIGYGPSVEGAGIYIQDNQPGVGAGDYLTFRSVNITTVQLESPYPDVYGGGIRLEFGDPSGTAFNGIAIPPTLNLDDFTSARMSFSLFGGGTASGAIATFVAVPEPGVWALLVVGFGGVGSLLRQQRRRALPA